MPRGRPKKKPVELLKGHRSNKYMDYRSKAEQKTRIGKPSLGRCPNEITGDPVAMKKWLELCDLYEGFQFVTSADRDLAVQYCVAWSVYCGLLEAKDEIIRKIKEKKGGESASIAIFSALSETDTGDKLSKQTQLLQKLSDKMFLNPTSRIQAIPDREEKKKQSPLEQAGFGGI